ncbi:hypothetical protein [Staphylococcus shinii]|uniref:hypothetical protein n=1 Tax=Staphylococcus shinii TaxID=2912228 RepID=UPI003EEC553A
MRGEGYGMVLVDDNGCEMVEIFMKKETALIEINKVKRTFEKVGHKGTKIYLSKLNYDVKSKKILDDKLVNQSSQLKMEC